MTPEQWMALIGIAGTLLPGLLSRLGVKIPFLIPAPPPPPPPQVPVADKPIVDCLAWIGEVKAKRITLDAADLVVAQQVYAALPEILPAVLQK